MYGYDAVLSAYRAQAQSLIAAARSEIERSRLQKQYAECVLRNRAKLLVIRLQQTTDESVRQRMVRQALL